MGVYLGGTEYASMYVGGVEVSGVLVAGAQYKAAARDPLHTYTITVGRSRMVQGYWWNSRSRAIVGDITDAMYDPGGGTVTIRQTMMDQLAATGSGGNVGIGTGKIRLLLNRAGTALTTGDLDQFPASLEIEDADGNVLVFSRGPGFSLTSYGQGIGGDYTLDSGTPSDVMVEDDTVTVRLYY